MQKRSEIVYCWDFRSDNDNWVDAYSLHTEFGACIEICSTGRCCESCKQIAYVRKVERKDPENESHNIDYPKMPRFSKKANLVKDLETIVNGRNTKAYLRYNQGRRGLLLYQHHLVTGTTLEQTLCKRPALGKRWWWDEILFSDDGSSPRPVSWIWFHHPWRRMRGWLKGHGCYSAFYPPQVCWNQVCTEQGCWSCHAGTILNNKFGCWW